MERRLTNTSVDSRNSKAVRIFCDIQTALRKLYDYEDTELSPKQVKALKGELKDALTPRPIEEWGEDYGDCLWWRFPIEEPPYCGSPLDENFTNNYYTHFTRLIIPIEVKEG